MVGVCGMAVQFPRQREIARALPQARPVRRRRRQLRLALPGGVPRPRRHGRRRRGGVHLAAVLRRLREGRAAKQLYRETGHGRSGGQPGAAVRPVASSTCTRRRRCSSPAGARSGASSATSSSPSAASRGRRRCRRSSANSTSSAAAGVRSVFFVDDNLIGHLPRCEELLRFLADVPAAAPLPVQVRGRDVGERGDPAGPACGCCKAANFEWVFVGIETPEPGGADRDAGRSRTPGPTRSTRGAGDLRRTGWTCTPASSSGSTPTTRPSSTGSTGSSSSPGIVLASVGAACWRCRRRRCTTGWRERPAAADGRAGAPALEQPGRDERRAVADDLRRAGRGLPRPDPPGDATTPRSPSGSRNKLRLPRPAAGVVPAAAGADAAVPAPVPGSRASSAAARGGGVHVARSLAPAVRNPRLLPFVVQNWTYGLAIQSFATELLAEVAAKGSDGPVGPGQPGHPAEVAGIVRHNGRTEFQGQGSNLQVHPTDV